MRTERLDDLDVDLVGAATAAIRRCYRDGWHFVGAALRTSAGRVHTGVNLQAYVSRISVCAEAVAIGSAVTAGHTGIERIVAVFHPGSADAVRVVAPCGMCRELIADYGPHARVVIPGREDARACSVTELLPQKYTRS